MSGIPATGNNKIKSIWTSSWLLEISNDDLARMTASAIVDNGNSVIIMENLNITGKMKGKWPCPFKKPFSISGEALTGSEHQAVKRNFGFEDGLLSVPLYALWLLNRENLHLSGRADPDGSALFSLEMH